MSLIQIQVVTWNSRSHLERLFLGIERQVSVDFNVVVIDNASQDGTVEWIEEHYSVIPAKAGIQTDGSRVPPLRRAGKPGMTINIIRNKENKGFAAGHNQGFAVCEAPYVLVLNPDTELQAGYLEEVLRVMECTPPPSPSSERRGLGIAAVQGKLYRELPKPPLNLPLGKGERCGGGIIDSFGLKLMPWWKGWQAVDIGQNQADKANFEAQDHPQPLLSKGGEIFGATGACAFYRLEALKQVADKHGIFDERFGSYKEDVDLAWRLKKVGWKAIFTPKAIAWHGRRVGRGDRRGWRIRYLSLRNHVVMVGKNLRKLVVRN